jgi:hypothetical protein
MIPALERAKTVHALDRAAAVIGTTTLQNSDLSDQRFISSVSQGNLPIYDCTALWTLADFSVS